MQPKAFVGLRCRLTQPTKNGQDIADLVGWVEERSRSVPEA
ncbi:hypothetical protein VB711_15355 [Cronbergia sp. UHCC 0137]|nr:hypothetical protein [Cronbergia sp. UHCC 0137]MEA5619204.1 hypothetical protein [Cronbergia sp. UHCC 0137]